MRYYYVRDGYQHYVAAEDDFEAAQILARQAGYETVDDYMVDQEPYFEECDSQDELEVYDDDQGCKITKTLADWMDGESGIICSELT